MKGQLAVGEELSESSSEDEEGNYVARHRHVSGLVVHSQPANRRIKYQSVGTYLIAEPLSYVMEALGKNYHFDDQRRYGRAAALRVRVLERSGFVWPETPATSHGGSLGVFTEDKAIGLFLLTCWGRTSRWISRSWSG